MRPSTLLLCALMAWPLARTSAAPAPVDFSQEVRPILSAKCYHCHGPDEASRKANLRLDLRDEALKERDGIRAIVPGDLNASDLVTRIISHDKDEVMPPPKEGEPLTKAEQEILQRWIQQGAEYRPHWAWTAPMRPEVPLVPAGRKAAVRNPIDHFILERLQPAGLWQSPEADRATLLRRLSLDLTGLPPTPEEVAVFVQDREPNWYEKAVDRFLGSPAFGERWARVWLDLARYADSTGYGSDFLRLNIWPYRDWVIQAFNRNLPYDQFTVEQLAGDLLPNATPQQITATAFHRNTMTNVEGGTVDEEYRVAAVKDRIATTAQVWMGLTLQCAQCHTHKFDPISHRDYYSFFAIFNQTEDNDLPTEAPLLPLPTPEETARHEALKKAVAEAEMAVAALPITQQDAERQWASAKHPNAPAYIQSILATPELERSPEEEAELSAYYRSITPTLRQLGPTLANARKELGNFKPLAVPVMRELPKGQRRKSHILAKGNYLAPAEEVSPALLTSFGAPKSEIPPGRLEVARWLVSPKNPLTARVAVNRFWAQLFGTGLVETEEDFGTQGTLPSHPHLLDWLAVAFQSPRSADPAQFGLGWDMKALLRLLVSSGTYRQSSRIEPAHLEKDPRNRLLAHYPRRRLEAETVRDQALALSGLLTTKVGGPSVYPPQPDGLWRVAFNGGQNGYVTSTGADRYRRGLYTIWRRTMPYPSMATFDAPSRESCTVRRQPTNTPLQAFVTMNDPCYVECAQVLARRILKEGGLSSADRLRWALRLVLARPPEDSQVAALKALLEEEQRHYSSQPEAAAQLAASPTQPLPPNADAAELAAWTVVANVLLNLDGVLSKS